MKKIPATAKSIEKKNFSTEELTKSKLQEIREKLEKIKQNYN